LLLNEIPTNLCLQVWSNICTLIGSKKHGGHKWNLEIESMVSS
jgi:hypothetical protein